MSIVIRKIKPVEIGMRCDECGEGMMRLDVTEFGAMVVPAVLPPVYRHKCDKCGAVKEFDTAYPRVIFENHGEFREPDMGDLVEIANSVARC